MGKGDRGAADNRGNVFTAHYYHEQVELNLASKLLDTMQNMHSRIVPLKKWGSWLRAAQRMLIFWEFQPASWHRQRVLLRYRERILAGSLEVCGTHWNGSIRGMWVEHCQCLLQGILIRTSWVGSACWVATERSPVGICKSRCGGQTLSWRPRFGSCWAVGVCWTSQWVWMSSAEDICDLSWWLSLSPWAMTTWFDLICTNIIANFSRSSWKPWSCNANLGLMGMNVSGEKRLLLSGNS